MKISLSEIENILKTNNVLVELNYEEGEIKGIAYDSREVKEDYLFFCKGSKFKSEYLSVALKNGALVYISEKKYDNNSSYFIVSDIKKAMALISAKFYNYAYKDLETIAITGTKGKTTVTYFIKNILDEYTKAKSAVISTVEVFTGVRSEEAHLTTPESPLLHELFYETKKSNIKYLTMEVTSQAYKTKRVEGIHFNHGMFLNISEDHISDAEHKDFNDYFGCKLELMKNVDDMIINRDMEHFETIKNECIKNSVKFITYGKNSEANYVYKDEKKCGKGFSFTIINKDTNFSDEFQISMQGRFNIENAVAAASICANLGVDKKSIKKGLFKTSVEGRMNVFEKNGLTVIVDYAHNLLSFTKLYESIKLDYPNKNIISLGGGPGGKSYKRREDFGKIVGAGSNYVVLTAEDPQFETVESICSDIIKFLPKDTLYKIIEDRSIAIEEVISNANENDLIILLGKGEEEYQKVEGNFIPYESDIKIVKRLLNK